MFVIFFVWKNITKSLKYSASHTKKSKYLIHKPSEMLQSVKDLPRTVLILLAILNPEWIA